MKTQKLKLTTQRVRGSSYRFAEAEVSVPDVDTDIRLVLPSGEKMTLQYRVEGDYPSLDICFDRERETHNWARDMGAAPAVRQGRKLVQHVRKVLQLCLLLNPAGAPY